MKKLLAYLLSCTSIAAMNYLVISYSFVKNDLIENFSMNQIDIGIADSMRMIGGVTGLLIFTFNTFIKNSYVIYFSVLGVIYALLYGSIPILYYLEWRTKYVIFVINLFTGLVKAPTWPLMLEIINNKQYYDQTIVEDKWKMIVWSAMTNMGSVFALIFSNVIVYSFYFSWTVCLFFGSAMVITFSVLVGIFFYGDSQKKQENFQIQNSDIIKSNQKNEFSMKNSIFFLVNFILNFQTFSFIVCYMLTQQIQQVYAMFLPLFLNDSGYDKYKGYVSSGFIICRVVGALMFSLFANSFVTKNRLQDKNKFIQDRKIVQNQFKQPASFQIIRSVSIFLLAICSILLAIHQLDKQILETQDLLIYSILISFSGFFLGGPMSQLQTFQMLDVINTHSKSLKNQSQLVYNSNFQSSVNKKQGQNQVQITLKQQQQVQISKNQQKYQKKDSKEEAFKAQLILGFIQVFNYLLLIPLLIVCGKILQIDIQYYFPFIMSLCVFLCFMDLMREAAKKFGKTSA